MHPVAGHPVDRLDAVAGRPDAVGVEDPHLQVGDQAAPPAEGQPGVAGQRGLRADADAEHDEVGGERAVAGGDRAHVARRRRSRSRPAARRSARRCPCPPSPRAPAGPCPGRGSPSARADRVSTVTVEPAVDHRLGHLDADVAAADDDRPCAASPPARRAAARRRPGSARRGCRRRRRRARPAAAAGHRSRSRAGRSRAGTSCRRRGRGPRPRGGRRRAPSPRTASAGRCRWPGAPPACGRPGRRPTSTSPPTQ